VKRYSCRRRPMRGSRSSSGSRSSITVRGSTPRSAKPPLTSMRISRSQERKLHNCPNGKVSAETGQVHHAFRSAVGGGGNRWGFRLSWFISIAVSSGPFRSLWSRAGRGLSGSGKTYAAASAHSRVPRRRAPLFHGNRGICSCACSQKSLGMRQRSSVCGAADLLRCVGRSQRRVRAMASNNGDLVREGHRGGGAYYATPPRPRRDFYGI
jgi:hypothetical protein